MLNVYETMHKVRRTLESMLFQMCLLQSDIKSMQIYQATGIKRNFYKYDCSIDIRCNPRTF